MVRLFSTIDTVTNGPCIGLKGILFIKLFQKSQLTDIN